MPKYDYDIVVIGGGAAGLTASGICASFGAKTALVEKDRLGGDCTWSGCVPSKSLLHIAKELSRAKRAAALGIRFIDVSVDFATVMDSVRSTRQRVYEDADSPELMQGRGVEIMTGTAAFEDAHSIEISGPKGSQTLSFRSAIVTAGGSPLVIPISGLQDIDYLTNETIFELTQLPDHLVILGSGPIGVEMAQAFRLLGSKVTVIALDERILIRDEPKCTVLIRDRLESEGVSFNLGQTIHSIKKNGHYELQAGPLSGPDKTLHCDAILVAVGRTPNLESLNLEKAGIQVDKTGIPVDKYCRTNVKHIFAAGDITTFLKFTHVAENMAKTAAVNAVLRFPLYRFEQNVIPWVTYTDPECAHVGKTAEELQSAGTRFDTIELPYKKIDRAVTEHESEGWIIVHTGSSGKILGAHAVGAQAGEIINEYALAMKNRLRLTKISNAVHAYPTMLLGARRAADQYYVRLQKRWMSKLIRWFFGYKGDIPEYVGSKEVL
ncbi:FAD-dependent oxidoreductase [bacterium]|nr:FAD-dependent oxidoreductase [bacterium]